MQKFNIGRTLSRSFQIIGNGIGNVGVFLLIASVVNAAVSLLVQSAMVSELTQIANPADPTAALKIFTSVWYWLSLLFSLAIGAVMYSGSIHGYLRVADGTPTSIGDCVRVGFAKLLPMMGLTVLWIIGISFASMLLVVPGIILATMWVAAMPALVGEGLGVSASFGRSRNLTRGSRWSVFGVLFVLLVVFYILMAVVLGGVIGGTVMGGGFDLDKLAGMANPLTVFASALIGWATSMLLSAVVTSIYVELVEVNEGGTTGKLGEVFE